MTQSPITTPLIQVTEAFLAEIVQLGIQEQGLLAQVLAKHGFLKQVPRYEATEATHV